eukprot:TRINITY_DN6111_c0_g6_i1.p1 TRINITY_DN6111_c0_g6~~TRINITY_DN6111_c0_g6_i1.p1  ORF type:complete len:852 (-),score=179.08 TRINITY_DN6111_c0_g6_i1:64-2619(-)
MSVPASLPVALPREVFLGRHNGAEMTEAIFGLSSGADSGKGADAAHRADLVMDHHNGAMDLYPQMNGHSHSNYAFLPEPTLGDESCAGAGDPEKQSGATIELLQALGLIRDEIAGLRVGQTDLQATLSRLVLKESSAAAASPELRRPPPPAAAEGCQENVQGGEIPYGTNFQGPATPVVSFARSHWPIEAVDEKPRSMSDWAVLPPSILPPAPPDCEIGDRLPSFTEPTFAEEQEEKANSSPKSTGRGGSRRLVLQAVEDQLPSFTGPTFAEGEKEAANSSPMSMGRGSRKVVLQVDDNAMDSEQSNRSGSDCTRLTSPRRSREDFAALERMVEGSHDQSPRGGYRGRRNSVMMRPIIGGRAAVVIDNGYRGNGMFYNEPGGGTMNGVESEALKKSKNVMATFKTEDDDKRELRELFSQAECVERQNIERSTMWAKIQASTREEREFMIDTGIATVIVLNAISIGISMDASEDFPDLVLGIDGVFSTLFVLELVAKLALNGITEQFCGVNRWLNIFDASLIIIDIVQLVLVLYFPLNDEKGKNIQGMPPASLFRMVRLVRLARMIRLLRIPIFKTLAMMLHGMLGGMSTLGWAVVLFSLCVYVVALLFREYLGRLEHPQIMKYFNTVPRAMFTIFRCSFGDCTTDNGHPIFEYVDQQYGYMYSMSYCGFVFVMSVGLFNVISAIFVESTLAAATKSGRRRKRERLANVTLWSTRIYIIIKKLLEYSPEHAMPEVLSEQLDEIYDLEVTCDVMDTVGQDPVGRQALLDLDLEPDDIEHLSDILDPDHGGSIAVIELIEGIRRLRGDPRRSDIVMVDLMIRSIQANVDKILTELDEVKMHCIVRNHGSNALAY